MERFTTQQGKPGLLAYDFKYRLDKTTKTTKLWRCTKRGCQARCKTDLEGTEALGFTNQHNHEEDTQRDIQLQKLRQQCKRKASEDPFERPSKIIRTQILTTDGDGDGDGDGEFLPSDIVSARRAIYRRRRKTLPRLPKNRRETHEALADFTLKSNRGEDMIHVNDEENGIIIFTTQSNLELLCEGNANLYGDGTFKVCPRFFYQLYTLHVYNNGWYVPSVFCLLMSKTQATYTHMFRHIKELCTARNLDLNVSEIHLDFEKATHLAAQEVMPNASIKACLFHLGQAWWRKINALGLREEYIDQASETGRWMKCFFGLSYLRPEIVPEAFAFDLMNDAPDDARTHAFADYVLKTFARPTSTFPPVLWASEEINHLRTTNACESFHKHFADLFYSKHPSIFDFMEKLKLLQTESYAKMTAINSDVEAGSVRRHRRLKLEEMHRLQGQYKAREMERFQYIKAMAYKNLPPMH